MTDAETGLRRFQVEGGERSLLEPYDRVSSGRSPRCGRCAPCWLGRSRAGPTASGSPRRRPCRSRPPGTDRPTRGPRWTATARAPIPRSTSASRLFDSFRTANAAVGRRLQAERDAGRRATPCDNLNLDPWVVLHAPVIAMVMAGLVGRRMSRSLTGPLADLHRVVTRQHQGERDLGRARTSRSPRSATSPRDFNRLLGQQRGAQPRAGAGPDDARLDPRHEPGPSLGHRTSTRALQRVNDQARRRSRRRTGCCSTPWPTTARTIEDRLQWHTEDLPGPSRRCRRSWPSRSAPSTRRSCSRDGRLLRHR